VRYIEVCIGRLFSFYGKSHLSRFYLQDGGFEDTQSTALKAKKQMYESVRRKNIY